MKIVKLLLLGILASAMSTVPNAMAQGHMHGMQHEMKKATADTVTAAADTVEEVQATYRCPMHHEVVSDKPGKCPKCGMKLEKVAVELVPAPPAGHTGHMHDMSPEGTTPVPPQSSDSVKTDHQHHDGMSAADKSGDCSGGNRNASCNSSSAGVSCAKASAGSDEL